MTYSIVIVPRGRLGNLMFQYLLAWEINRRLENAARIYGPGLGEWGIEPVEPAPQAQRPYRLKGHSFDLDQVTYALRTGLADTLVLEGWGMRLEYYADWRTLLRPFQTPGLAPCVGDHEILINVRAEDIETGQYPGYYPLPFDFYAQVIKHTGLAPVFMGQIHEGKYAAALRATFAHARFLEKAEPIQDFQTLQAAKHLVIAPSSFAWLAAWSSSVAQTIHYPVVGILDPRRGVQNLMPVGDPRYVFWETKFPLMQERQKIPCTTTWALAPHASRLLTRHESHHIAISGFMLKVPPSAIAQPKG